MHLESDINVRCKHWWSGLIAGSHQIQWERPEGDGMKVFASRSSVGVMKMEDSRSVTQKSELVMLISILYFLDL